MGREDDLNKQALTLRDALKSYFLPSEIYQEVGSGYTPTYTGGTTAGTTTYTLQVGSYVRIGIVVYFRGTVVWTAATGTGDARISLPLTVTASANNFFSGSLRVTGVTFANSAPQMMINPNTAYFTMDSPLTNAAPTTVAIEAAGNVVFSGFYFIV